jgi:hypothetical protein
VQADSRCTVGDLAIGLGSSTSVAAGQYRLPVVLKNRSAQPCRVFGFPGLRLVAGDGSGYDIPRSPLVTPTALVLRPGAAAHADLTYLAPDPGDDGAAFVPTRLLVTPPDEFSTITLTWTRGPVIDQQAATHPGTFVTALAPGAGG